MASPATSTNDDQAKFWNEDGGRRWVEHIDQLEQMLTGMSEVLFDALSAQPGERVLDIGCGGGPTSAAYARAVGPNGRVLGLDNSAVILAVARQRFSNLSNLSFETADAATYAFEPGAFDVLTSRFGIMFFPQPVAAFSNLRRALAPTGRACFMCWRRLDENPWMAAAAGADFCLIGHSERRHVFGETDAEVARKVSAALEVGMTPVVCVGEKIDDLSPFDPEEFAQALTGTGG